MFTIWYSFGINLTQNFIEHIQYIPLPSGHWRAPLGSGGAWPRVLFRRTRRNRVGNLYNAPASRHSGHHSPAVHCDWQDENVGSGGTQIGGVVGKE